LFHLPPLLILAITYIATTYTHATPIKNTTNPNRILETHEANPGPHPLRFILISVGVQKIVYNYLEGQDSLFDSDPGYL
jgi:hypothetical protein